MKPSSQFHRARRRSQSTESGYILITLMLLASLVVIMLAVVLPQMSQQIRRDREQELIHRGVQYSRAIRRFFKKNGRYPVRLEELENSNNIRYLRARYKYPVTGKDFKLLHFGEVQMGTAGAIAGGVAPGANAQGAVPGPAGDLCPTAAGRADARPVPCRAVPVPAPGSLAAAHAPAWRRWRPLAAP